MTIYDDIKDIIISNIKNSYTIPDTAVISEDGIPDDSLDFFIRPVWTYGQSNDLTNNTIGMMDTLILELYERKQSNFNILEDLIRNIRFDLSNKKIYSFDNDIAYAKYTNLIKHGYDDVWKGFSLSISFTIIKEAKK